ncbi:MAG: hypothetical protein AB7G11_07150 [Phycisphaerales bacterium]
MKINSLSPILNVSDVPASVTWFESLGWSRAFTWNSGGMIPAAALENALGPAHFAGVCADPALPGQETTVFLCKDAQGARVRAHARGPTTTAAAGCG